MADSCAILILALVLITPCIYGQADWALPSSTIEFNVKDDNYDEFHTRLYDVLKTSQASSINGHPVLQEQTPPNVKPSLWIFVAMKYENSEREGDEYEVVLALRADNLYLLGFAANDGGWYMFQDEAHLNPGSTPLQFGRDYESLLGHDTLVSVPTNKESMRAAMGFLVYYSSGYVSAKTLKKSLAQIILTICEAQRFYPIRDLVSQHWDDDNAFYVDPITAEWVHRWRIISCALLAWNIDGRTWSGRESTTLSRYQNMPVMNAAEALTRVGPILQTRNCRVLWWTKSSPPPPW